ncbi:MAG: TonB family protein [Pirellulales bacterium]
MTFDSRFPAVDPVVDVAEKSIRSTRQLMFGIAGSAAAHGGAALLVFMPNSFFSAADWHPPSPGIHSIELVASVEGDVEPDVEFTAHAVPTPLDSRTDNLSRRADGDRLVPIVPETAVAALGTDSGSQNLVPAAAGFSPRENRRTAIETTHTPKSHKPARRVPAKEAKVADAAADGPLRDAAVSSPPSKPQSGAKFDKVPSKQVSPRPEYPPAARAAGHEGRVVLRIKIAADGRVQTASVHRSSGYRSLDRSALRTVMKWRFDPALLDGRPVACEIAVPFRFEIVQDRGRGNSGR